MEGEKKFLVLTTIKEDISFFKDAKAPGKKKTRKYENHKRSREKKII